MQAKGQVVRRGGSGHVVPKEAARTPGTVTSRRTRATPHPSPTQELSHQDAWTTGTRFDSREQERAADLGAGVSAAPRAGRDAAGAKGSL